MSDANLPNPDSLGGATYITKSFLEHALNKKWGPGSGSGSESQKELKVAKFKVSKGSAVGDGYTTMLYTVDIWLEENHEKYLQLLQNWFRLTNNDDQAEASAATVVATSKSCGDQVEPLSLIIKCVPDNPMRQEFLVDTEIFTTELEVYENVIRDLVKFQENGQKILRPPFAPFISGAALTTAEMKKLWETRPLSPLDNYIMMADIRKNGDFKLVDRFDGFDLDHHKLVVEAHAQLHATSWAYKCKKNVGHLRSLYPNLRTDKIINSLKLMEPLAQTNIEVAKSIVTRQMNGDLDILKRLDDLKSDQRIMDAYDLYYDMDPGSKKQVTKDTILRVPGRRVDNEEPWAVLLHGDAWSNNMMFRYDEATGKPVQVVLLDLQLSRQGDPMSDLSNTIYTGTSMDYRAKYLNSMLHVYRDTFLQICRHFEVAPLPNFTMEELSRRFHRAKIYGMAIAFMFLPLMLTNPDHLLDLESISVSARDQKDHVDVVEEKTGGKESNFESPGEENEEQRRMENMQHFTEAFGTDLGYDQLHPVMIERMSGILRDMTDQGVL